MHKRPIRKIHIDYCPTFIYTYSLNFKEQIPFNSSIFMYRYPKLLLVASTLVLSSALIAMDEETKEAALQRIRSSGYIAQLTDLVDDDMISDNYRINRIQHDFGTNAANFHRWAAAQILAGCNTDILFQNNKKINCVTICKHLIPLLESRHANDTDYARAKAFLQQALITNHITISDIEKIQLPEHCIGLAQTVLYKLAKQISEPENPNWAIKIHNQLCIDHVAIASLIGFGCGILTCVAYTWWNEQEDSNADDKDDDRTKEISG